MNETSLKHQMQTQTKLEQIVERDLENYYPKKIDFKGQCCSEPFGHASGRGAKNVPSHGLKGFSA